MTAGAGCANAELSAPGTLAAGKTKRPTNCMNRRSTTISVRTPFALKPTVLANGWHECHPMSWSEGGQCLQIIERDARRAYRVSVTEARRSAKSVSLAVTVDGNELTDGMLDRACADLRVVLGLDRDLSDFYALCAKHPTLRILRKIGAGRGLRSASMTENILKSLCQTNVAWAQAVKMINRIGQLGPMVPNFANLTAWPTPREVFRAGRTYLTDVCRLGYRADTILKFCEDVCEGRFDPETLDRKAADPEVTSEQLLRELYSIRGIGPGTASWLLSFLGRHDRLTIDSSTVAHVARVHTNGKKPTFKQIERIYEPYGEWKNMAWWYEHWLTWSTAREIVRTAGLDGATKRRNAGAPKHRTRKTRTS